MWSEECKVQSVKCGVWSEESKVYIVDCEF